MIAKFSFWKSNALINPKAVLVLVPPSQSDGRAMVSDLFWQSFAQKHDLALVGCFFQDRNLNWLEEYCDVKNSESGEALIDYVYEHVNKETKLLLWGFSAGGQFNYEFTCEYPHLVAGFVVNKGGVYYTALASPEARAVPGLWIVGEHDSKFRRDILYGIHGLNKAAGAKWSIVSELCGHSIHDSIRLGADFFVSVLNGMK